ncbi:MAG: response regulator [Lentisphaerae bacterium]|nr:response regulator [Lentisphaerota bacterium]
MNGEARPSILLVDDDKHLLITLGDFLGFEGFEVTRAESAEDALRQLEHHTPDLIVLDISMPGMGGLGFLREIADEQGVPRYPVLVLTARAAMEQFFENVEADGFLSKPCAGVDLVRAIRKVLAQRALGKREPLRMRGRILLVENHPPTSDRLVEAFGVAGYAVDVVKHGLEIFRKASKERPDVIISKEFLPAMKGSAVALMVKGHKSTQDIPFILYDSSHLMERQYARGAPPPRAVATVVLTDEPEALLAAVEGVLEAGAAPIP